MNHGSPAFVFGIDIDYDSTLDHHCLSLLYNHVNLIRYISPTPARPQSWGRVNEVYLIIKILISQYVCIIGASNNRDADTANPNTIIGTVLCSIRSNVENQWATIITSQQNSSKPNHEGCTNVIQLRWRKRTSNKPGRRRHYRCHMLHDLPNPKLKAVPTFAKGFSAKPTINRSQLESLWKTISKKTQVVAHGQSLSSQRQEWMRGVSAERGEGSDGEDDLWGGNGREGGECCWKKSCFGSWRGENDCCFWGEE